MGSKFSRWDTAKEMAAKAAFQEISSWSQSFFRSSSEKKRIKKQKQEKIAEILIEGLGHLKGMGLKVLQNLALDEDLIPPAMLKSLEKSFYRAEPLSPFVIKKVLQATLQKNIADVFTEFDETPIGVASLGQVHRARLTDGSPVVVKVQYPNIEKDLTSEVQFLNRIARWIENPLVRNSIQNISNQVMEELDFAKEVQSVEGFRKIYQNQLVIIPKVYHAFCGPKLIVMEELQGRNGLEAMQLPESKRRSYAQGLFDFYMDSFFNHGALHGDPHPGNFLLTEDLKLAALDFGICMFDIEPIVREMFAGLLYPDRLSVKALLSVYEKQGARICDGGSTTFFAQMIEPYQQAARAFMSKDSVNLNLHRGALKAQRQLLFRQSFNPSLKGFNNNLGLIHKAFNQLFLFLSRLGAPIDTRRDFS